MKVEEIFDLGASVGRDELGEVFKATLRDSGTIVGLKLFDDWVTAEADACNIWRAALENLHAIGAARTPRTVKACIRKQNAWLATHWVEGPALADVLSSQGPLPESLAASIGCGILDALVELHESGSVHGGVTPDKVILTHGLDLNGVVITDPFQHFLYSVTNPVNADERRFIGVPRYFSPEQAMGTAPSERSEVYVIGLILYEMITGVTPFAAESRAVTLRRQMNEPPMAALLENPDIDVSEAFQNILNQSLDKDPRKRFPDIASLRHLLTECSSEAASSTSTAQPLGFVQGADITSVETVIFSKDFE